MTKTEEFLANAKDAQRYAAYAMLPELRLEYQRIAAEWLGLVEMQAKLDLAREALVRQQAEIQAQQNRKAG